MFTLNKIILYHLVSEYLTKELKKNYEFLKAQVIHLFSFNKKIEVYKN